MKTAVGRTARAALSAIGAAVLTAAMMLPGCGGDKGTSPDPEEKTYRLTTAAEPAAGGTVSPATGNHAEGAEVSVAAAPADGYTFTEWTGADAPTPATANPATVTMDGDKTLTANFAPAAVVASVTIGTQTWMAENLDYDVPDVTTDVCYNNDPANCEKYGRLYEWETAKTACPSGWHLPTDDEWTTLTDFIGERLLGGKKLKSSTGWESGAGTDDYGFSALPGGYGAGSGGDGGFGNAGYTGYWWSATEHNASNGSRRVMSYNYDSVNAGYFAKTGLMSVRCLKN